MKSAFKWNAVALTSVASKERFELDMRQSRLACSQYVIDVTRIPKVFADKALSSKNKSTLPDKVAEDLSPGVCLTKLGGEVPEFLFKSVPFKLKLKGVARGGSLQDCMTK